MDGFIAFDAELAAIIEVDAGTVGAGAVMPWGLALDGSGCGSARGDGS